MRPIWFPKFSVNHRLPSGPAAMAKGSLLAVGVENSVMVPTVAQAGRLLRLSRLTPAIMAVISAVRCDRHPERFMFLPPLCIVLRCATHNSHASVSHCLLRQRTRRLHDQGEK